MKKLFYLVLSLLVASILLFTSSCSNTGQLKKGWHSTASLKKKGYNVPENAPKQIYIRPTGDSSKVNIFKSKEK